MIAHFNSLDFFPEKWRSHLQSTTNMLTVIIQRICQALDKDDKAGSGGLAISKAVKWFWHAGSHPELKG